MTKNELYELFKEVWHKRDDVSLEKLELLWELSKTDKNIQAMFKLYQEIEATKRGDRIAFLPIWDVV